MVISCLNCNERIYFYVPLDATGDRWLEFVPVSCPNSQCKGNPREQYEKIGFNLHLIPCSDQEESLEESRGWKIRHIK